MRQYFVIHLDQRQRLIRDDRIGGRDGGDGVPFIERLLARHDVAGHMPEIDRDPLRADVFEFLLREIFRRYDGLDPGQRRCLGGIDRADPGVGVRRAQDLANELSRHRQIGGVHRPAGYLRHPIRAYRPRANPLEPRHDIVHGDLLRPSTIIRLAPRVARHGRKNKPLSAAGPGMAGLGPAIQIRHHSTSYDQPSPTGKMCHYDGNRVASIRKLSLGKGSEFSPEAPACLRRSGL